MSRNWWLGQREEETPGPAPELVAVHARIHGRVQGVWFRDSTCKEAQKLRVGGWVKNLLDGSVEAEFHGPREAVRAMVRWCHKGPPLARVDKVELAERAPDPERAKTFEIVY